jgi:hypothetical protein
MSVISDLLNQIMTAVYGKDVRQAIHDAIQQCYLDSAEGITPVITTETVSGSHNINITVGADTTTVFVANGQNGQNGTNGTNGTNGQDGQDGQDGVGSLPDGTYTAQEIHTAGTLTSSGTYVIFFVPFINAVNRTVTITPTKISVRDRGSYLANNLTTGVTYEYVQEATGVLVKAIKSDGWGTNAENNSVVSVQFTFDLTVG